MITEMCADYHRDSAIRYSNIVKYTKCKMLNEFGHLAFCSMKICHFISMLGRGGALGAPRLTQTDSPRQHFESRHMSLRPLATCVATFEMRDAARFDFASEPSTQEGFPVDGGGP